GNNHRARALKDRASLTSGTAALPCPDCPSAGRYPDRQLTPPATPMLRNAAANRDSADQDSAITHGRDRELRTRTSSCSTGSPAIASCAELRSGTTWLTCACKHLRSARAIRGGGGS